MPGSIPGRSDSFGVSRIGVRVLFHEREKDSDPDSKRFVEPSTEKPQNPQHNVSLQFSRVVRLIVVGAALLCPAAAGAHPVPFTYLDLHVQRDSIEGSLVAHMFDLGHDLSIDPSDRLLDPAFAASNTAAIIALLSPRLTVSDPGTGSKVIRPSRTHSSRDSASGRRTPDRCSAPAVTGRSGP